MLGFKNFKKMDRVGTITSTVPDKARCVKKLLI